MLILCGLTGGKITKLIDANQWIYFKEMYFSIKRKNIAFYL